MIGALNAGLALLILALASWTVVTRDTFAAVVGFIVYGLLLAMVWVQLEGVDIALTEAALGSGLTGALLLGAVARTGARGAPVRFQRPAPALRLLAALVAALLTVALAWVVLTLPVPAPTLSGEVAARIAPLELGNPITAVLMAFRALDTLLEAIVVLFALIGVWSLAADSAWGGRPGVRRSSDPDTPLDFLTRMLPPVGVLFAVYIFWIGADAPGGKFQGATLLAAMWLLPLYAGVADAPVTGGLLLRLGLLAGPLVFLGVGLAGIFSAGAFLAYPAGWEKAHILLIEWVLLPSLALTLALIVAGPPRRARS